MSGRDRRGGRASLQRAGLPVAVPGLVVGLLGGSFDPPHEGHLRLTRAALARFGLDRVWWLVTPGNPLKAEGPAPLARRIEAARALVTDPRVTVTDIEARIGTRHTAATLERLRALYPGVRFVWLMGSDNLAGLHRWDRWQRIMQTVPVGVVARPGSRMAARRSLAARRFAAARLPAAQSWRLGCSTAPAWCLVEMPLSPLSSTQIRARGDWARDPAAPLPGPPGGG
ncbi:MAG: nicotinate-nucleotide adenylyltransferase [Gemmobacter sp.]